MYALLLPLVLAANPPGIDPAVAWAWANTAPRQQAGATVCDCPITGVCKCPQCPCGTAGYVAVWKRAQAEGKPFVIFAGTPRRDVPGACTIGFEKWCSDTECFTRNVVVCRANPNGTNNLIYHALPVTATDQQIVDAWKSIAPLALRPGEHSHVCSRCGYEWAHTSASQGNLAAHTCPQCHTVLPSPWMPARYGPSAGSYRLSVLPSFAANCPTGT